MDNRYRDLTWLLVVALATGLAPFAPAQEQEKPKQPAALDLFEVQDPAVQAILETKPSTPLEWTRAARILADLGRPKLAKGFLKKVLDAKLNQDQLAALTDEFGSAMFTDLISRPELAPEARQLADVVLTSANRKLCDPKRLAGLVKQLQDPSVQVRFRALAGLQEARAAAVGPLVAVLADTKRASEHANVRAALVRLGSDAVHPLIGILEAPDAPLVAQAIQTLAAADARRAIPYILGLFASPQSSPEVRTAAEAALKEMVGRLPTRRQTARLLAEQAREYFDHKQPLVADAENRVELWSWDPEKKECVARQYHADDASLLVAARLAHAAHDVEPANEQIRMLYLATMLEVAAYENGLDKPLPPERCTVVAESGPGLIEQLMEYGIATDHEVVATVAARILGRKGTAEDLLYCGAEPAPLVRAAGYPNRRLRFAAVEAIMQLQPKRQYAGSSTVLGALEYFAASSGVRRVVVAGPGTEVSQRLTGFLNELKCEVDTARTGRELTARLVSSPDYQLALIYATVEQPPIDLLMEQLQQDCRTALLPVALIAPAGHLERAKRIAGRYPLAEAFSRPHSAQTLKWQIGRLLALAGRHRVGQEERKYQAVQAMRWLADLSSQPWRIYNLARVESGVLDAAYVPELSLYAVEVLKNLGTAQSQRALVELASRWTQPLELRKAAVAAFGQSTQKHGILLTTEEILRQYERYNRSRTKDRSTQQLLALILDSIEAPTQPLKPAEKRTKQGNDG